MEGEAPGWDAIDAALAPVVGGISPQHWETSTAEVVASIEGDNPLLITGGPGLAW
jgi:hypothetical protein